MNAVETSKKKDPGVAVELNKVLDRLSFVEDRVNTLGSQLESVRIQSPVPRGKEVEEEVVQMYLDELDL